MKLYELAQSKIPKYNISVLVCKSGKYWGVYMISEWKDGEKQVKVGNDFRIKKMAVDYAYDIAAKYNLDRTEVVVSE